MYSLSVFIAKLTQQGSDPDSECLLHAYIIVLPLIKKSTIYKTISLATSRTLQQYYSDIKILKKVPQGIFTTIDHFHYNLTDNSV